ncbi:MAG: ornithine cyclodeaminase family protein [Halobacteriaceae archaeon]
MPSIHVLSDEDIAASLSLEKLLPVIVDTFKAQQNGAYEQPSRPHFPVGTGENGAAGTALTMPAYIHDHEFFATKLVTVHERNPERNLPTVQAQIVLTDATTGEPVAFMAGNRITNARTGCIGGIAAQALAHKPITLGLIGAGTQARWQARAIATATSVETIKVYSPSDSKYSCANDLASELDVVTTATESPENAVMDADVVVTATTSTEPVVEGSAIPAGAVVVAVGAYTKQMQELDATIYSRATACFADVPEEVAQTGGPIAANMQANDFLPFATICTDEYTREDEDDILIVNSVGTALLDVATAEHIYEICHNKKLGTVVTI